MVLLTSLLFVKLNTSVIVFCGQDIDILNGEQFVDWINIDILLMELLFVSLLLSTTVFVCFHGCKLRSSCLL